MTLLVLARRALALLFLILLLTCIVFPEQAMDKLIIKTLRTVWGETNYDVEHIDLDVSIDPDKQRIAGNVKYTVRLNDDSPESLLCALWANLKVTGATSAGVPLDIKRWGHFLWIPAARSKSKDEMEFELSYAGTPSGQVSYIDNLIYKAVNTYPSTKLKRGGIELNPYNAWHPVCPAEGQFFTWTAKVSEPVWFQTICGGIPTSCTVAWGTRTTTWESDGDTVSLSAMGGQVEPIAADGLAPISFHGMTPSDRFKIDTQEIVTDVCTFYSELFGGAPFPHFRVVEIPRWHGNSYCCDLIALRRTNVSARGLAGTPSSWGGVTSHELGHVYWGVAVRQNVIEEGIWIEGLTEYSSCLYMAHRYGADTMRKEILEQHYSAANVKKPRPMIRQYNWSKNRRGLVYRKSCSIWRMLHYVLGDEAFFATLRSMLQDSRDNEHRPIGMSKIQQLAEKQHGQPLNWFFDYWVYDKQLPDYSFDVVDFDEHSSTLSFTLKEHDADSLRWPLTVEISGGSKSKQMQLSHQERRQPCKIKLDFLPESLEIDPEIWILDRNRSNNRAFIK
jgi:Peptidase family M1 domain